MPITENLLFIGKKLRHLIVFLPHFNRSVDKWDRVTIEQR